MRLRSWASEALDRYQEHDAVRFAETRSEAKDELIKEWSDYRAAHSAEKSSVILAHTRVDVAELNGRAPRSSDKGRTRGRRKSGNVARGDARRPGRSWPACHAP